MTTIPPAPKDMIVDAPMQIVLDERVITALERIASSLSGIQLYIGFITVILFLMNLRK